MPRRRADTCASNVVGLKVVGSYSCRPMNNVHGARLSEHGHANAIDVAGFELENGYTVAVKTGWWGALAERMFLRAVHSGSCNIFTTVLGPHYDRNHRDHFHLDLARHPCMAGSASSGPRSQSTGARRSPCRRTTTTAARPVATCGSPFASRIDPPLSPTISTGAGETPTRAIVLLALAGFVSAANLRVCDPLLPQIAGELGVTIGGAGAVVTAFALAYGLCQIFVGPLGDAQGKLRLVVLGSLWAGISTLLCAAMPTLAPVMLLRFLAGAGGAAIIPLAIAWLGDVDTLSAAPTHPRTLRVGPDSGRGVRSGGGRAARGAGRLAGCHGAGGRRPHRRGLAARQRDAPPGHRHAGPRPRPMARGRDGMRATSCGGPGARILLGTAFLEGVLMFGAFAYVGAHLHQSFGVGPGLVGITVAAFGIGALLYALTAGTLIARFGQARLTAAGSTWCHRLRCIGAHAVALAGSAGRGCRRPGVLHAAQHAADRGDATCTRGPRALRVAVCDRAVHGAVGGRGAGRAGGRPMGRATGAYRGRRVSCSPSSQWFRLQLLRRAGGGEPCDRSSFVLEPAP